MSGCSRSRSRRVGARVFLDVIGQTRLRGDDGEGEAEGRRRSHGREVREGILGDQGNRSGKQTDEEEREREEEGRSGFLWQMGCETIRGGASRGGRRADRRGRGMVRPKATMAS